MAYQVHLKDFDGPLDLLLTLITRAKVDIREIFVSEITRQYLDSMAQVSELDMDTASEFLAMAAVLIEIKSRALLPRPPKEEPESAETPEQMLIRQLEEYKRFKETAQNMKALEEAAACVFYKLPEEYPLPPPPVRLEGLTLDGLVRAFADVMARVEREECVTAERHVQRETYTVSVCMFQVQQRLSAQKALAFASLFDEKPARAQVVAFFMAILELLRLGRLRIEQQGLYAQIMLYAA